MYGHVQKLKKSFLALIYLPTFLLTYSHGVKEVERCLPCSNNSVLKNMSLASDADRCS